MACPFQLFGDSALFDHEAIQGAERVFLDDARAHG